MMKPICKKCLLLEAGENAAYETVQAYLDNLDESLRVDDDLYHSRLSQCKDCEFLIAGMCRKCGCYAEIRAALKNKSCADYNSRKW